jgi:hypothetical protein
MACIMSFNLNTAELNSSSFADLHPIAGLTPNVGLVDFPRLLGRMLPLNREVKTLGMIEVGMGYEQVWDGWIAVYRVKE